MPYKYYKTKKGVSAKNLATGKIIHFKTRSLKTARRRGAIRHSYSK